MQSAARSISCWNCDPCWLLRPQLMKQDRLVFVFCGNLERRLSAQADQCPQLLYIYVVLALETEKEKRRPWRSRQHRSGLCPMVTQAVASFLKGLRNSCSPKQRSSTTRLAETIECLDDLPRHLLPGLPLLQRSWHQTLQLHPRDPSEETSKPPVAREASSATVPRNRSRVATRILRRRWYTWPKLERLPTKQERLHQPAQD